jgi:hypothetical protein
MPNQQHLPSPRPTSDVNSHASGPSSNVVICPSRPLPTVTSTQIIQPNSKQRRNKAKRERWKVKSKLRGLTPSAKRERSATGLADRLARSQTTTIAQFSVASLPKSGSGLSGSRRDIDKEYVARLRDDQGYFRRALTSLHPVPYEYGCQSAITNREILRCLCSYSRPGVVDFRDCNNIRFGLRAFRDHRMDECFMERLVRRIDRFMTACGVHQPAKRHTRGSFAQAIIGHTHGMGEGNNVRKHNVVLSYCSHNVSGALSICVLHQACKRYRRAVAQR